MVTVSYGNAGAMYGIAKEAYSRVAAKALGVTTPESPDALTSIVFSALATEAFINELPEFAKLAPTQEPWMADLAELGKKIEDSNGQITLKLAVIFIVLTGSSYPSGQQPFQNFELLVKLRNELAHVKPLDRFELDSNNQITHKPRSILARLPQNIIAMPVQNTSGEQVPMPLVISVGTQACAKWACNTLAELVNAVVLAMPASQFRTTMESYRDQFFQPLT